MIYSHVHITKTIICWGLLLSSLLIQSINVHQRKDTRRGVVNNQILDWSFKLDGIFNNASQDQVFETVGSDIITAALDGYNGNDLWASELA